MRGAVKNCYDTHDCGKQATPSFVPTRLLDLGEAPEDIPVLVLAAEAASNITKYAALSYCWGPQPDAALQLKTEVFTLHDRLQGIPMCTMSPVMRDAVEVCRLLSIRYLWIDSLCIIQDQDGDDTDWARESELMADIFQNAHVTICAMSSDSCQKGFLQDRFVRKFPSKFNSRLNPGITGTYWLVDVGKQIWNASYAQYDNNGSEWSRRGWVFQETELSARLLQFGAHMLHFECSKHLVSADGNEEASKNSRLFSGVQQLVPRARTDPFNFHYKMESYASMKLTVPTDRLQAIASLARMRSKFLPGDDYLAGIWKSDLPFSLLWSPDNPPASRQDVISSRQPSNNPVAPSWSWACQAGRFHTRLGTGLYERQHIRREYHDFSVSIIPYGSSRYGRVKSGIIIMTAKFCTVPSDLYFPYHIDRNRTPKLTSWTVHLETLYVAECRPDWAGVLREGEIQSKQGLWVLLMSSSCLCALEDSDDDMSNFGEESSSSETQVRPLDPSTDDDTALGKQETPTERHEQEQEGESDDREVDDEVDADHCRRCGRRNDEHWNRNAWGLLLTESEQQGKFIRVGTFTSIAREAGGTKYFDKMEFVRVEII